MMHDPDKNGGRSCKYLYDSKNGEEYDMNTFKGSSLSSDQNKIYDRRKYRPFFWGGLEPSFMV